MQSKATFQFLKKGAHSNYCVFLDVSNLYITTVEVTKPAKDAANNTNNKVPIFFF